jgi:hypothetical protein
MFESKTGYRSIQRSRAVNQETPRTAKASSGLSFTQKIEKVTAQFIQDNDLEE